MSPRHDSSSPTTSTSTDDEKRAGSDELDSKRDGTSSFDEEKKDGLIRDDERRDRDLSDSEDLPSSPPLPALAAAASCPHHHHHHHHHGSRPGSVRSHRTGVSAVGPDTPAQPPPPQTPHFGDVPDGGLAAWLQVVGAWVILAETWGLVNSFGVYQSFYESPSSIFVASGGSPVSSSSISWIGSLQASMLMLVGLVSGPLFDAGWCNALLASGLALIVLGMFMTSLCTSLWQVLLAQGVTVGVGCGLVFLPSAAIMSQYFRRRRALAIGVASAGSPVAGIAFPIIFARLQPTLGFAWATRIIAFILLGLSAVPLAVMRTRVPPSGKRRGLVDQSGFRDASFLIFCAAMFFGFLTLYVAFFYLQLYAESGVGGTNSNGGSNNGVITYLVTILNAGSVIGRLAPNYLADRLGSLNMMCVCMGASAVLVFGWLGIAATDLGGLAAFGALYGLFSGGVVSLTPSVITSLTPDLGRIGARMGMLFFVTGISILIGTPIGGAILGGGGGGDGLQNQQWKATVGYAAASLTLATLGCILSRLLLYRKNSERVA